MIQSIDPGKLCMGCMAERDNEEDPCPVCGFQEKEYQPVLSLPCRSILNGKYLTGKVLGERGFGITYLGWDLNLNRKMAIKEYYPYSLVCRESDASNTVKVVRDYWYNESAEAFTRGMEHFLQEAMVLANCSSLPGIVSVKELFLENNTAYFVMEYLEGMTLKQYLQRQGGRLPAGELFACIRPVIESLDQVHRAGLIHRDINPDNIMLTNNGHLKLFNFEAERSLIATNGAARGLPIKLSGYEPFEKYNSRLKKGPWTDVYALCATLYKCLTGERPAEFPDRMMGELLLQPSERGADTTPAQDAALMEGLAIEPKNRFQTMEALERALY